MTSMRTALMSNPTLAATIQRQERLQALAARPRSDLKYRRDVAISALIRARRNHKRTRDALAAVMECVAALRLARA